MGQALKKFIMALGLQILRFTPYDFIHHINYQDHISDNRRCKQA